MTYSNLTSYDYEYEYDDENKDEYEDEDHDENGNEIKIKVKIKMANTTKISMVKYMMNKSYTMKSKNLASILTN